MSSLLIMSCSKTKKHLDNLPPAAYMEAQKLIGRYQDVLKRLEGF